MNKQRRTLLQGAASLAGSGLAGSALVSVGVSAETKTKTVSTFRRAHTPTQALAQSVSFDDELMHVALTDGRIISVPIFWFPLLWEAMPEQRTQYEIGGGGTSLHWEAIDEDLSVAGLLAGADARSG